MDQVFEGTPAASLSLEGQRVTRGEVVHDWASRLQWRVSRDGQVVATPQARLEQSYEHPDKTPGVYEIVLEMWKYEGYQSGCQGKYVEVSNKVTYTL